MDRRLLNSAELRCTAFAVAAWMFLAVPLFAGDWPQILGPQRDGTAAGEQIADSWPASGPPTLWQRNVGSGFAGVAVAKGTAILFHRQGNEEIVEALDALTGKTRWRASYPTRYSGSIVDDDGPRCVPVIHQDRVIVYGAQGDLHCLELNEGKKLWSRATLREFGGSEGYFGAGSTPIAEGNRVFVNVGGSRQGAGIVAFDLQTGKSVWKATDEAASYSAPTAATVDGKRHIIFVTRLNVVSVDPENGDVRFRFPFGARGPTVNAATPLVLDRNLLFVTASYGVGATLARIGNDGAEVLWNSDEILSSQYPTPVVHEGKLYGTDGRQDVGVARLRCIDPLSQRVLWSEEGFGMAVAILAGDKLILVKTDGELVLAAADPEKFRPLAKARVSSQTIRALPTLADGRLYIRDTSVLKCLDLRPQRQ